MLLWGNKQFASLVLNIWILKGTTIETCGSKYLSVMSFFFYFFGSVLKVKARRFGKIHILFETFLSWLLIRKLTRLMFFSILGEVKVDLGPLFLQYYFCNIYVSEIGLLFYILLMYARIAAVFPSFFFAPLLSAVFCVLCHPSSRLDVPVATRNSHSSIMRAS